MRKLFLLLFCFSSICYGLEIQWFPASDDLSTAGENASTSQIAIGLNNTAVAVWQRQNGLIPDVTIIQAAYASLSLWSLIQSINIIGY